MREPLHREAGNPARQGWRGPHGPQPCAGCGGSGPVHGPRERTGLAGIPAPAGRTRRNYAGRASAERRQPELLGREFEHLARGKGGDGSQLASFEAQVPAPPMIGLRLGEARGIEQREIDALWIARRRRANRLSARGTSRFGQILTRRIIVWFDPAFAVARQRWSRGIDQAGDRDRNGEAQVLTRPVAGQKGR